MREKCNYPVYSLVKSSGERERERERKKRKRERLHGNTKKSPGRNSLLSMRWREGGRESIFGKGGRGGGTKVFFSFCGSSSSSTDRLRP